MARQVVGRDELLEHWTVPDEEQELLAGKRGATRLGFVLLLKYYTRHGRFPHRRAEFGDEVVAFVARQVNVAATEIAFYEWSGRTIEYHRKQIRTHLGFRVCGVADADADKLTDWLSTNVAHAERIEPPTPDRIMRMVRSALSRAEEAWFATIEARLSPELRGRVLGLVEVEQIPVSGADDEDAESVLGQVKAMPGNISLESMLREIEEGLNVVESWNAAHAVIYYGKGGEVSTNRREEVERAALCLRILQASLVYVNTLMLQDVLTGPAWSEKPTPADRRGLTPLFWSHVRPYGEVNLDLGSRLDLGVSADPGDPPPG